jgi:hypothetical protein
MSFHGCSGSVGCCIALHPPHICAVLQFLVVPRQHWSSVEESTVIAFVNAFYFSLSVLFHRAQRQGSQHLCLAGCLRPTRCQT